MSPELSDELARLEAALEQGAADLEASTVRVIERNLEIIDRAISESMAALQEDPSQVFLRRHLESALERKAQYLRSALDGPPFTS